MARAVKRWTWRTKARSSGGGPTLGYVDGLSELLKPTNRTLTYEEQQCLLAVATGAVPTRRDTINFRRRRTAAQEDRVEVVGGSGSGDDFLITDPG